jgi:hypothetical protein
MHLPNRRPQRAYLGRVALTKALWPIVFLIVAIVFIVVMKPQLAQLLDRVSWLHAHYNKGQVDIDATLDKVAQTESEPAKQEVQKVIDAGRVQATETIAAKANPTAIDLSKVKALRQFLNTDLQVLAQLLKAAAVSPRVSMKQSWDTLEPDVLRVAEVFGFEPPAGTDNELKQSLLYLTTRVQASQNVMIGVYGLAEAHQKVLLSPDGTVKGEDAERFVRSCMTIVAELSLQLDQTLNQQGRGPTSKTGE